MARYLLMTHSADGDCGKKMSQEEMMEMWGRIQTLESEMKAEGAFVMSVRLRDANETKVVRKSDDELLVTDGPFIETKEQLAGFYLIEAPDDDAATSWASKVTECIGRPIEMRGFQEHAGS